MGEFSKDYFHALREATAHHESSKTYSGKFLRPHAPFIKDIIIRFGAVSVLDYGCGKGRQYEWVSHGDDASIPKGMTIEQYWDVPVTKFDPAWRPFAERPKGKFDLVLCTHTLGAVPISDQAAVIADLFDYANDAVYIAEKIGPTQKQVFSDPTKFPREWTRAQWEQAIRAVPNPKRLEIWLVTRERKPEGVIVDRRIL